MTLASWLVGKLRAWHGNRCELKRQTSSENAIYTLCDHNGHNTDYDVLSGVEMNYRVEARRHAERLEVRSHILR